MHELKVIREMTGLSQQAIAAWLNVSRSLVYMVEQGKRSLPGEAHFKLVSMMVKLMDKQQPGEIAKIRFTDPIPLAELHKKKMAKHRKLATSLQGQLEKLQRSNPRLQFRLKLFELMKESDGPGYSSKEADQKFIEMTEWFTHQKLPKSGIEEQELLQDKIDSHLAYADLHQERWRMYVEMM